MPTVSHKPKDGQDPAMQHVAARLDAAVIERLDALAKRLAPLGAKACRSTAVRAALLTGLPIMEAQYAKGKAKVKP